MINVFQYLVMNMCRVTMSEWMKFLIENTMVVLKILSANPFSVRYP